MTNGDVKPILQGVFEEHALYDGLDEFYKRIFSEGYRYVIIVPRKCLTAYKEFNIMDNGYNVQSNTKVLTTKAFPLYKKEIENELKKSDGPIDKYIAVIDDIILYGRGINQFLRKFTNAFEEEIREKLIHSINLEVFIESSNDLLYDEAFEKVFEDNYSSSRTYYSASTMKRASDLFIDSFYATATPNTSFIRSWFVKKIEKPVTRRWENTSEIKKKVLKQNNAQIKRSLLSKIFYEENKWLENITEFSCIRTYYNGLLNKEVLIPYVFLKPLKPKSIDNIFNILENELGIIPEEILEEKFHDKGLDIDFYILKYEYLTCILSDLYGAYFWNRYGESEAAWSEVFDDDSDILAFSYKEQNVFRMEDILVKCLPKLKNLQEALHDENILCEEQIDGYLFEQENEARAMINYVLKTIDVPDNETQITAYIKEYFALNSDTDETKAVRKEKERIFGVSTGTLGEIIVDKPSYYSELLKCMDTGISSLTIKSMTLNEDEEEIFICSVVNAGEQAYRIKVDEYMPILHYLAKIEKDCKNLYMMSRCENKVEAFLKLVDESPSKPQNMRQDMEYIRKVMNAQNRSYADIYVNRCSDNNEVSEYEKYYYQVMK